MSPIETELTELKKQIGAMWQLISEQMKKAMKALATMNREVAGQIMADEQRVNAMEVEIDRRCEQIFAQYNPVASDLRLVLALLKINSSLERIGDVAASVARYIMKSHTALNEVLLEKTNALAMFEEAADFVDDALIAFESENTQLAAGIITRDRALNELNRAAKAEIIQFIKSNPQSVEECLNVLAVARKLERAGDRSKNIAGQIISYVEARESKSQDTTNR